MINTLASALSIAQALVASRRASGEVVTRTLLDEVATSVIALFPQLGEADKKKLVFELEGRFHVWMGDARILEDNRGHIAWLPAQQAEIRWAFWDRYKMFLSSTFAPAAVGRLDEITDDILARLENPARRGSWSRRGLIVGHVQSGKTANYTGLICKAADAGYKVIVVLAGLHKNLRTQTQIRLDEGFLGYESGPSSKGGFTAVGVGRLDPSVRADSITHRGDDGDFKKNVAKNFSIAPGGRPLLFVVKKNGTVLKHLLDWVKFAASGADAGSGRPIVRSVPLLVIDDEADHASVDTRDHVVDEFGIPDEDHEPTIINSRIRQLLHWFEQSAYVGYTATPFANIYIHEKARTTEEGEDLFPQSFIINLPAPSNYFGPAELFGQGGEGDAGDRNEQLFVRLVADALTEKAGHPAWMPERHKSGHEPRYAGESRLPPSLVEAVRAFILAGAARLARGQTTEHKSMLVHVTRFTNVQRVVYAQVAEELSVMKSRWRNGDGASPVNLRKELQELWNKDFLKTSAAHGSQQHVLTWRAIEPHVFTMLSRTVVKEINGSSADILAYEEHAEIGLNVIAIGGDKLSRGLTLEGLTVSYFLRSSKMYDTLMQMGRWFGYRPGYNDLCRLYLTTELVEWFRYIADASEELREQFDHMVAVGATPKEYGLRVRSHPVLMVTSRVKSRTGTDLELSYTGAVTETVAFHADEAIVRANLAATEALLAAAGPNCERSPRRQRGRAEDRWEGSFLWKDIPGPNVLAFLRGVRTHERSYRVNAPLMADYIARQIERGELTQWTIALLSGSASAMVVGGFTLPLVVRTSQDDDAGYYRIRQLLSPKDEAMDLDAHSYENALNRTRANWTRDPGRSKRMTPPDIPAGPEIRAERPVTNGLLLLYPLRPPHFMPASLPIIGFGISFPATTSDVKVKYRVNNIYYEQEFGAPA